MRKPGPDAVGPDAVGPHAVGPDAPEDARAVDFDPTGLDLARRVTAAVSHTTPLPPAKPRKPRKKDQRGRTASDRGEPVALGEALEGLIHDRGWATEVNVHLLLGRWPELVGEAVAQHTTPEAYRDRVVVVRTTSTNWATQLGLMAPQLVAKLNAALGDGTIRAIRILGPQAPSWKHGPRTVQGRGPRDTYG